jgi:multiple sugar transport system permease protein
LAWNDFALAAVLTHKNATTLPTIINMFETEEGIAWAPISAASILAILPAIIFITFTHKGIMRGLTFGATKG